MATIDQKLLEILACPLSKAPVVLDGERLVSTDSETRRAYRIEDGIPIMLIDESEELSAQEHAVMMKRHNVSS
jgi:uncharacterized protein